MRCDSVLSAGSAQNAAVLCGRGVRTGGSFKGNRPTVQVFFVAVKSNLEFWLIYIIETISCIRLTSHTHHTDYFN